MVELEALPERTEAEDETDWPYLEVRVRLDRPDSSLRRDLTEALEGKAVRFVKLTVEYSGGGESLAQQMPRRHLQDLEVETVFMQLHQSRHDSPPRPELLACFREIVDEVRGGGAG
jgi:exonuclease SbcD